MKTLSLLAVGVVCALIAASAMWFALQGSRVSAPRQNAAQTPGASEEIQAHNEALRAEKERLERENAQLKRDLAAKAAQAEKPGQPEPAAEKPQTPPADTTAKPATEDTAKPAEAAPENAAIKATRDAAITDFLGSDENAADDAMKLLANLAKNGDTEARKVLIGALKSENPYVRELAVEAIGIMANPDDLPLLEAALKDSESKVREEAVEWIGNYPPEKSGPILTSLLADADARVVRKAADRLGDMKWEAAKPDLIRLAGGSDENLAVEAAVALRRMGDTSAAENLVPTWGAKSKSADAKERENAAKQLRRMRLESTRAYLEALLNDENSKVRDEAKKAIKQLDKDAGK